MIKIEEKWIRNFIAECDECGKKEEGGLVSTIEYEYGEQKPSYNMPIIEDAFPKKWIIRSTYIHNNHYYDDERFDLKFVCCSEECLRKSVASNISDVIINKIGDIND